LETTASEKEEKCKFLVIIFSFIFIFLSIFILVILLFHAKRIAVTEGLVEEVAGNLKKIKDRIKTPSYNLKVSEVSNDDYKIGAENPKIIFIEYVDLNCEFCAKYHNSMKEVLKSFPNEVSLVVRHAPIKEGSVDLALVSECMGEQGVFWEFLNAAFAEERTSNFIEEFSKSNSIDKEKLEECFTTKKYQGKVEGNMKEAENTYLEGTPHTIILLSDGRNFLLQGFHETSKLKRLVEIFIFELEG